MAHVQLIAGLGNPGSQYERTRHNIGFAVVDAFASHWSERAGVGQTPIWKERGQASLCELRGGAASGSSEKLLLVKPMSFMNRSGEPLREIVGFYKVELSSLVIVHDEVDLPLGTLRIKRGGGDGGHNGIRSVCQSLGSNDFMRVRVGVGRPAFAGPAESPEKSVGYSQDAGIANWVLGRFSAEEAKIVSELITRGILALESLCTEGMKAAQNKFNS